jgi:hypothetical protein
MQEMCRLNTLVALSVLVCSTGPVESKAFHAFGRANATMLQQLEIKRLRKHREQAFNPFSHSSDRREQQPAETPAAASSHMQVEAGIRTELGIATIQRKVERAGAAPAQPAAGGSCNSYCKDACSQFVKPTDSVWECSACTARQVGARGCFPGAMGYMGYNAIRGGRAVEAAADEWERAEAAADAQATAHEQAMGEEPAPPAVLVLKPAGEESDGVVLYGLAAKKAGT